MNLPYNSIDGSMFANGPPGPVTVKKLENSATLTPYSAFALSFHASVNLRPLRPLMSILRYAPSTPLKPVA